MIRTDMEKAARRAEKAEPGHGFDLFVAVLMLIAAIATNYQSQVWYWRFIEVQFTSIWVTYFLHAYVHGRRWMR